MIQPQVKPGPKSVRINPIELKRWRKSENLTQEKLADKLDSSTNTVGGWEQNIRSMSFEMIGRWISVFGFNPVNKFGTFNPNQMINNIELDPIDGKKLKIWRVTEGYTQHQLAQRIRCSLSYPSEWEREVRKINQRIQERFEDCFGFDPIKKFRKPTETGV